MSPKRDQDVAPLAAPSRDTGEAEDRTPPDDRSPAEGRSEPVRGMHVGETKIGPLNDPND